MNKSPLEKLKNIQRELLALALYDAITQSTGQTAICEDHFISAIMRLSLDDLRYICDHVETCICISACRGTVAIIALLSDTFAIITRTNHVITKAWTTERSHAVLTEVAERHFGPQLYQETLH